MRLILLACVVCATCAQARDGRYLTWIDDQGQVHNTFVDAGYSAQQREAGQRIDASDQARLRKDTGVWSASGVVESKRRYFTWVDANGTLHNSSYAGEPGARSEAPQRLRSGEYVDADVLEGRNFVRSEQGTAYYTWVDDRGQMRNSPIVEGAASAVVAPAAPIAFSEGRQVAFTRRPAALPALDGRQSPALQALLQGNPAQDGPYRELLEYCCDQLAESDFTELSADEPRYQELNRFSPSLAFPMGRSYYAALALPRSQHTYGLRVRSFANQQVVYPSLLFLDEHRRPTRLVSDAVYQLHPETWYRYAFIEGTVAVQAAQGERYVLLLTTDEDRALRTLDNQPFKRPLQAVVKDEAGMQVHRHGSEGGFELAIVR